MDDDFDVQIPTMLQMRAHEIMMNLYKSETSRIISETTEMFFRQARTALTPESKIQLINDKAVARVIRLKRAQEYIDMSQAYTVIVHLRQSANR